MYKNKEKRAIQAKKYRAANREKLLEYGRQYYSKHKIEHSIQRKQYYLNHKTQELSKCKSYVQEHKKERNQYVRQYTLLLKEEVFNHYGHKCQWEEGCDVTDSDMLQIDHINGDGFKDREMGIRGGDRTYRHLINNGYPEGYRLLCANHNWKHKFNLQRKADAV